MRRHAPWRRTRTSHVACASGTYGTQQLHAGPESLTLTLALALALALAIALAPNPNPDRVRLLSREEIRERRKRAGLTPALTLAPNT